MCIKIWGNQKTHCYWYSIFFFRPIHYQTHTNYSYHELFDLPGGKTDRPIANSHKLFISWIIWLTVLLTDRPLGGKTDRLIGRWTDFRVTVRLFIVLSTDRLSGGLTDRPLVSLISQNWHLSSAKKRFLTPFFCQKKFLSCRVKFIEKKEGKSICRSS